MELRSRRQIDATSCQRPSYSGLAHSWRPGRRSPRCDEGARRWLSGGRGHGHLRLEELATASVVHHDGEGTDTGGEGGQPGRRGEDSVQAGLSASMTAGLASGDDACGRRAGLFRDRCAIPRDQQMRGSGSPTSRSTIRVPPNAVFSCTIPGGPAQPGQRIHSRCAH